jgi:hypothetical protein
MPNKYNARRTVVDGIAFDSRRESERYAELRLLERAGEIEALELQPKYVLQPPFEYMGRKVRALVYVADFTYIEGGTRIIEDVKGRETPDFRLKWKLLQYRYRDDPSVELRKVR